jgi:hypothetical protein
VHGRLLEGVEPLNIHRVFQWVPSERLPRLLRLPEHGHHLWLEIGGAIEAAPEPAACVLLDPMDELGLARFRISAALAKSQHWDAPAPGDHELLLRGGEARVKDRFPVVVPEQQKVDIGLLDTPKASLAGGNWLSGVVLETSRFMAQRQDQAWQGVPLLLQASAYGRDEDNHLYSFRYSGCLSPLLRLGRNMMTRRPGGLRDR